MQHPIQILERYWNYTNFRPLQEDIIESVLQKHDTFVLLPTGGGKSMCFQIPALILDGICIVVSPLIALMKNQVADLKQRGIKAIALTSDYSKEDVNILLDNCIYGNYKFLYLSPERLQNEIIQERLRQMNVNLIAVDEAHCISQWGNDFRPAYKNIETLRRLHPSVNVIALTASATPIVVKDTIESLDFIAPKIFKQSFYRERLAYMVFEVEDKLYHIERILKKNPGASIIYVRNRKAALTISQQLLDSGFTSTYYHGGLTTSEKDAHFSQWYNNQKQVMVATNAFGMGIDKPDVRTVIHINLPDSIESYFQEAGRAGRDGKKAYAVILTQRGDELHLKNQFLSIIPSVEFIKKIYRKLCNYFQISYGEGEYTTHLFNFNAFCRTYELKKLMTYNAIQALDRNSIVSLTPHFKNRTSVKFLVSSHALFNYLETHTKYSLITKTILRTYGGLFDQESKIDTLTIANKIGVNEDHVISTLKQLQKDDIIDLKHTKTDAELTFLQPREDDKTINRIAKTIERQAKHKKNQIDAVLNYVYNDHLCKSIQLLSYFGETIVEPCGICSVCIANKNTDIDIQKIKSKIINLLKDTPMSSRALCESLNLSIEHLQDILKLLLEEEKIKITTSNTYTLT